LRNPVYRSADCGVFKYRGRYYMSGTVGLEGLATVSPDLVHWSKPVRIIQGQSDWPRRRDFPLGEDEYHAPCFHYYNGRFHFYWNGIGHAVASHVLGPYLNPTPGRCFDTEIDPCLFRDERGDWYFYTVKFNAGNVIWGQAMASPDCLKGRAKELFAATPGTWESRPPRINEGPVVFGYRNRYYLLYAANPTDPAIGTYSIGCAVADSPLGFSEANKYGWPILARNELEVQRKAEVLIYPGAWGGPEWRYTTTRPPAAWMQPDFAGDKDWQTGRMGFGEPVRPFSTYWTVHTPWNTWEIWLRHTLHLEHRPSPHLVLRICDGDVAEVYFNGKQVFRNDRWIGPRFVWLPPEASNALHPGRNVVAVHCFNGHKDQRFVDVGLLDLHDHFPDDLAWNVGQPNVVRGLNGFEWWLTYFALWNEGPHHQGINRLFFSGRKLLAEGPTGAHPVQYEPAPYPATFSAQFETPAEGLAGWRTTGGRWCSEQGEARQLQAEGEAIALPPVEAATAYLFQVWLKSASPRGAFGCFAWYDSPRRWAKALLLPEERALAWETCSAGKCTTRRFRLSRDFDFSAWHKLRIERQGEYCKLWLDEVRLGGTHLRLPSATEGVPGLVTENAPAAFDAVTFTLGWDEFATDGGTWSTPEGRQLRAGKQGLVLSAGQVALKGDPYAACEFQAQVAFDRPLEEACAGIYPYYKDKEHWLFVGIEPATSTLLISQKEGEGPASKRRFALDERWKLWERRLTPLEATGDVLEASHCFKYDYVDAACDGIIPRAWQAPARKLTFWPHQGTTEWVVRTFGQPRVVSGSEVIWYDDRGAGGGCRVPASWRLYYRVRGKWAPVSLLPGESYGTALDKLNVVHFAPVRTTALKLEVTSRPGFGSGLYEWTLLDADCGGRPQWSELAIPEPGALERLELRWDPNETTTAPLAWTVDGFARGKWFPLRTKEGLRRIPGRRTQVEFAPVEVEKLRLCVYARPGTYIALAEAYAKLGAHPDYFLRCVKFPGRLVVLVDNRQVADLEGAFPAARCALGVVQGKARFNGVTCFTIPPKADP